jgi:hypothetical protein
VIEEVRRLMQVGPGVDPMAWLIDRGMKTLAAGHARTRPGARWRRGAPRSGVRRGTQACRHPDHETAAALERLGGMLGWSSKAARRRRTGSCAPSPPPTRPVWAADARVEPRFTLSSLTPAQRAEAGIPDGFLNFPRLRMPTTSSPTLRARWRNSK